MEVWLEVHVSIGSFFEEDGESSGTTTAQINFVWYLRNCFVMTPNKTRRLPFCSSINCVAVLD